MKQTKKIVLTLLPIALILCGFLHWPIEKVLLTATFGESRSDHCHNGIDLGGGGQKVHPIKNGALIYYFDQGQHPLLKSFGNGNIAVMHHNDNSRSYYYHLKKNSINYNLTQATTKDTIAITANSGRSLGAHLHLSYEKDGRLINPLSLFPKIKDKQKPKIASIYFLVNGRLITIQKKQKLTGVDTFTFLAKVYDGYKKIKKIAVLGIYRIAFYINKTKVASYTFDKFNTKNGRLIMDKNTPLSSIYHKPKIYNGGTYKNIVGVQKLSVKAWDFAGNMSSKTVTVTFK